MSTELKVWYYSTIRVAVHKCHDLVLLVTMFAEIEVVKVEVFGIFWHIPEYSGIFRHMPAFSRVPAFFN
jgi:hypothetical protein